MPDRYGNFTMADGLGIAMGVQGIQNTLRKEESHGLGMKFQQARLDEYERQQAEAGQVRGLMDNYAQLTAEGKALPPPTNALEMKSQAKFYEDYAKTEDGRKLKDDADMKELSRHYNNFRPYAVEAVRHIQAGDMKAARPYIEQASKVAPLPYRWKDDGSGFLVEQFRADATGDWEDVRHVTEEEAGQALTQIMRGEQVSGNGIYNNPMFMKLGVAARTATAQSNSKNWQDESKWKTFKDGKGNVYRAVPTASRDDWNKAVGYMLIDPNGKIIRNSPKQGAEFGDKYSSTEKVQGDDLGMFSMQELVAHGLQPEDLEREKKVLEVKGKNLDNQKTVTAMGLDRAKTVKTEAETGKVYADMDAKTEKDRIEALRNQISDSLKILKEVGGVGGGGIVIPDNPKDFMRMNAADRAPFIEKIVQMANDPNLSKETRSAAQILIRASQQRGIIRPPSEQQVSQAKKVRQLRDEGFSDSEIRQRLGGKNGTQVALGNKTNGSPSPKKPAPLETNTPSKAMGLPAAKVQPHPLSGFSNAKLDEYGSVWAKDSSGQLRRIAVLPEYGWTTNAAGQARRVSGQQVSGTPEYQKYLEVLQYFGLAPNEYGGR